METEFWAEGSERRWQWGCRVLRFGVRETEEDLIGRDIRDWEDREVGELRGASSL